MLLKWEKTGIIQAKAHQRSTRLAFPGSGPFPSDSRPLSGSKPSHGLATGPRLVPDFLQDRRCLTHRGFRQGDRPRAAALPRSVQHRHQAGESDLSAGAGVVMPFDMTGAAGTSSRERSADCWPSYSKTCQQKVVSVTPSALAGKGNQAAADGAGLAGAGVTAAGAGMGRCFFSAAQAAGVRVCIWSAGVVGMRRMTSAR